MKQYKLLNCNMMFI